MGTSQYLRVDSRLAAVYLNRRVRNRTHGGVGGREGRLSLLPDKTVKRLLKQTAKGIEARVEPSQLWCGRPVKVCDSTSVLMSDTSDNQQAYPQHSNQAAGCGFPIAQLVVMFCLTAGAVLDALLATFSTSELVLARQLYQQLQPEQRFYQSLNERDRLKRERPVLSINLLKRQCFTFLPRHNR